MRAARIDANQPAIVAALRKAGCTVQHLHSVGKGRGIKADDSYTIPLCHACHESFDQYKVMTKAESKRWFMSKLGMVDQALSGGWECPF